jgi:predicted naringenin-chalcone synthase
MTAHGVAMGRPGLAVGEHRLVAAEYAALATRLNARTSRDGAVVEAVVRRAGVAGRDIVLPPGADGAWPFYDGRATPPSTAERMAAYEALAPALAARAAREALDHAAVAPAAITHLITVSCTGFSAPGVDVALARALGLSASVQRLHLGFMGCHGAINGLRAAGALAAGGGCVLMVCVEICSLHLQPGMERDVLLPNALFGDGAAAVVLGGGAAAPLRLLGTAARLLPDSESAMSWRIGDHGFRMTLDSQVPAIIGRSLPAMVAEELARLGVAPADVGAWAIHPGGPRVVDGVVAALGLDPTAGDAARDVLARHGNMSSATVLFVLARLMAAGARGPIVLLAFGPGLTIELAVVADGTGR